MGARRRSLLMILFLITAMVSGLDVVAAVNAKNDSFEDARTLRRARQSHVPQSICRFC